MKLLHKHVIPKFTADWRIAAEFLELDATTIDHVEETFGSDPIRCCEETFRKWLKGGESVGPKTWSSLMTILKESGRFRAVAEEISRKLKIEG